MSRKPTWHVVSVTDNQGTTFVCVVGERRRWDTWESNDGTLRVTIKVERLKKKTGTR